MELKRPCGIRHRNALHQIVRRINRLKAAQARRRLKINRLRLRQHDLAPGPVHPAGNQPRDLQRDALAQIQPVKRLLPFQLNDRVTQKLRFTHQPPSNHPRFQRRHQIRTLLHMSNARRRHPRPARHLGGKVQSHRLHTAVLHLQEEVRAYLHHPGLNPRNEHLPHRRVRLPALRRELQFHRVFRERKGQHRPPLRRRRNPG